MELDLGIVWLDSQGMTRGAGIAEEVKMTGERWMKVARFTSHKRYNAKQTVHIQIWEQMNNKEATRKRLS